MAYINIWAVVVAAVANMAIGAAWYSPALFGKAWMMLSGITEERMRQMKERGMATSYVGGLVSALVVAYVLARFLLVFGVATAGGAATLAFWIWLGFVATILTGSVLWEGKPAKLYFINAAHYLVSLVVMAVILALWR